ncbi:MAG: uracil-DNA glycosylase family protein [Alphaproteobacteria bacterium]|nr:MAG: uracil-DNA glycosylase family protein [Alphaproteobacteria bacterium]
MSGREGQSFDALAARIRACRHCAARFKATATAHAPRPVLWAEPGARILIAGQAPGARVHESGVPFSDPSGDRLRAWLGLSAETFYDRSRIAILPMAFCFPGYDARGSDLPPPPDCARLWRAQLMEMLGPFDLVVAVGGHAQRWHLGAAARGGVTRTVARWREFAPEVFALPHPSWRNTAWLKRNPWFEAEVLPALRARIAELLGPGRNTARGARAASAEGAP